MPITPRTYKGMRDHLPEAMRLRRFIADTLIGVLERYGFEQLQTPIVEFSETLEGKIGEDEKLLYRLKYGDDALTLRYDQTVPLARIVAQYEGKITFPFKRYALGQSYRGERQARGRYREFWQLDADIVGVDSPIADAEVIAIVSQGLRALGFGGAKVLINHREILSGLARVAGVEAEAAGGVYRAIDKLDKIGLDGVRGELLKSGVSEEAATQILSFISLSGSVEEVLAEMGRVLAGDQPALAALENLGQITAALRDFQVDPDSYAISPSLARGLAYYTGSVFEAVLDSPPMGSLVGGGRYDNLIGMFSKRSLGTIGVAFGIERLFDVMVELNMGPREERTVDAYVTIFNGEPEIVSESLRLAGELRNAGFSVLTAYGTTSIESHLRQDDKSIHKSAPAEGQPLLVVPVDRSAPKDPNSLVQQVLRTAKLTAQFKEADRKGARVALVCGPDDQAAGVVQLKDLRSGEQRAVARAEVAATLRALL